METSGKPREGFMTLVPLAVFVLFVIFALGGPTSFLSFLSNWVIEMTIATTRWLRSL